MDLVNFLHDVGKLKDVKRIGWLMRKVKDPESVADHSYRLGMMVIIFGQKFKVDQEKALKMALVHDLPEAVCGDIASRMKEEDQLYSNKEKLAIEKKALQKLLKNLKDKKLAKEIFSLWQEFEAGKTKEAKLLRQLDRLECLFQTFEYEKQGRNGMNLQEFYDFAEERVFDEELMGLMAKIKKKRKKLKKKKTKSKVKRKTKTKKRGKKK
jgi:putative hydrolase of HD superfamily